MKSFSLLNTKIRNALSKSGFKTPTEIQELAIPRILKGKHSLLIAPTGMGKTEAALLPVLDMFLESRQDGIGVLYITPLRALNRDMLDRLEWWGKELGINIAVRHGDTSPYERRKQALKPPDMLITTPETLQAILPGSRMKEHLKNVRWVIVDEIHELAEDKRGAQLNVGLERLSELTKTRFQRIGVSATIGSPDVVSKFLTRDRVEILKVSISKAMHITVEKPKPKRGDREISEKTFMGLDVSTRLRRVLELIKEHKSSLIFVNTREMAEILASRLGVLGSGVGIHHSSLSQEARIASEGDFKSGRLKALICTSSMELGIDIGRVDLVMQYMSPRQVTRLLQRVGRSGHRITGRPKGIIITTDSEDIMEAIVIAKKALKERLEDVEVNERPYDVLAHQVAGITLDFGRVEKKKAYEIVKRSFVFRDLTWKEFNDVLSLMNDLKLLWLKGNTIEKGRSTRQYYYDNLSTIPDTKSYFVKNMVSQEGIGILDEAFVISNLEQGNAIIFKGAPWRVVSIEEEEIVVEPIDDITGAIPSWTGEEIPVPYDIAREVGYLRRNPEKIAEFPCDAYTARLATSKIRSHKNKGIPVPTDRLITIELFENFVIIHSCFGTKVNQTLGRVFSILLSSRIGHSVALQIDAYRIILQAPDILEGLIKDLFTTDAAIIEPLLSRSLKRTSLFRWKFLHVAKRFGAISKDVSYRTVNLEKVIELYEDSAIYKETLKELFKDKLDLINSGKVLSDIKEGRIEVRMLKLNHPSPIAELGLKVYSEIVVPERAERMIIKALKKRISERRVELFCIYCTKWSESFRVKAIAMDIKCANCGARMLAVLKSKAQNWESLYKKYKAGKALDKEEKHEISKMRTTANLFLSYGKDAVIALSARGIGPEVAKRILPASRSRDELYRNILKAERNYIRTKKFWD